jgi:multisubunit Na+/H+ antiporter MnhC subunit
MTNQLDAALLGALLFGVGVYLVLSKRFICVLFGFITLSNAANVLILAMSGDPSAGTPPVIEAGRAGPVDPLPQALILTAIVIGFGVLAYLTVLFYRMYADRGVTHTTAALDDPEETHPAPARPGKGGRHA